MKALPTTLSTALFALLLASQASATSYTCTNGDSQRLISVVYSTPGQVVPCEVLYEKDGSSQSLWRAEIEAGYCEAKAKEFADKQSGWGWSCSETGAPAGEEEIPAPGADGNQ